ncbi:MAG: hypothetical protein CMH83_04785 [Nocardioides sp.]|nr:hypothetical protein [Nocardioides sp.]
MRVAVEQGTGERVVELPAAVQAPDRGRPVGQQGVQAVGVRALVDGVPVLLAQEVVEEGALGLPQSAYVSRRGSSQNRACRRPSDSRSRATESTPRGRVMCPKSTPRAAMSSRTTTPCCASSSTPVNRARGIGSGTSSASSA